MEEEEDDMEDDDVEEGGRSQDLGPYFVRACAATLHGNLQEKCCRPQPGTTLCASLKNQNALRHFTRATSHGNLQEKCRGPK